MMTFEKVLEVFNDYLNKDSGLVWNIAKPPSFYGMPYLMAIVIF